MFDFTWGLCTEQNHKILVISKYKSIWGEQQNRIADMNSLDFLDWQHFDKIQPTRDGLVDNSLPLNTAVMLVCQNVLALLLCKSKQGKKNSLTCCIVAFTSFHAKGFINFPFWIYIHFMCIPSQMAKGLQNICMQKGIFKVKWQLVKIYWHPATHSHSHPLFWKPVDLSC